MMVNSICVKCQQPLRAGTKFCAACGTPVQVAVPPSPATHCPHCGGQLRPGAKFCGKCGRGVGAAAPPAPQPQATVYEPHPQTPAPPQPPRQNVYEPPPQPQAPLPPDRPAAAAASGGVSLRYGFIHILMIFLLSASLLVLIGGAYLIDEDRPSVTPAPPELTPVTIPTAGPEYAGAGQRVVQIGLSSDGRFGLTSEDNKRLTFDPGGGTSNTRVWVDGGTPIFGTEGSFVSFPSSADGTGNVVWEYSGIRVTQTLAYIIGPSGEGDTIRIAYLLRNDDDESHEVGLRIMIDTLIGNNDGVPFLIPGRDGITDHAVDLRGAEIPESIRAIENPNLAAPGVIVNLTLKGTDATPPDRVLITGWAGSEMEWDFLSMTGGEGAPLNRGGETYGAPDSAVGLFFEPQTLAPDEERSIVTYYGLGTISSTGSGNAKLGMFAPTSVLEGDAFYVTAVIGDPQPGEIVRLNLPDTLALEAGESAEQEITETGVAYTQVSWLVRACERDDTVRIEVALEPGGISENWRLSIEPVGITRPGGACP